MRDVYGTPGPYEDAVQNTPIFEPLLSLEAWAAIDGFFDAVRERSRVP